MINVTRRRTILDYSIATCVKGILFETDVFQPSDASVAAVGLWYGAKKYKCITVNWIATLSARLRLFACDKREKCHSICG